MHAIQNIHGRRAGRGLRPWLLLPKVMLIAVYFGTVAAAAILWWSQPLADPHRLHLLVDQTRTLFVFLAVPAMLLTACLGVGLFMQMPRQFVRLRWWQVKMASLAVGVPLGHVMVSARLRALRGLLEAGDMAAVTAGARSFRVALLLLLAGSAWIIVLGRLKPGLGQNWARDLPPTSPTGLEQAP